MGQIADAMAEVSNGSSAGNSALRIFSNSARFSKVTVPLSDIIDLGAFGNMKLGQGSAGYDLTASAAELFNASAAVSDGTHQVHLDLGATVPGVASLTADLAVGEPAQHSPWLATGDRGTIVRTAQTRLQVVAQVGGSGLLAGTMIQLPIYLNLAYAQAQLNSVTCPSGNSQSATVKIDGTPGIADMWIGDVPTAKLADFSYALPVSAAPIVSSPVVRVTGSARVKIGNETAQTLTYTGSDVTAHTVKSVSTKDFTGSLTRSLLGDLSLNIQTGGLSISSPAAVQASLLATLGTVTPAIDSTINNILDLAGVKLGEADVWVDGVQCQRSVLVQ